MAARWKKELRKAAEREAAESLAKMATPAPMHQPKLDRNLPASMQPGNDKLAFFWIAYFLFFLVVVPILFALL